MINCHIIELQLKSDLIIKTIFIHFYIYIIFFQNSHSLIFESTFLSKYCLTFIYDDKNDQL